MVDLTSPSARAFFDHYDEKRQLARRLAYQSQTPPAAQAVNAAGFATKTGDGTTSISGDTLSIAFGTTTTSLRGTHAVTAGKRYRVTWTQAGSSGGQASFGTTVGGTQYRTAQAGVIDANSFDFQAASTTLHLTFQRAAAGTTTFSGITVKQIPNVSWELTALVSPQTLTSLSAGVTIDGRGIVTIPAAGSMLFARGSFATEIGKLYRLRYTITGNTAFVAIGTSTGGSQIKSVSASEIGVRTYEFVATAVATTVQFHRTTAGTAQIADYDLQTVVL
jgi:hypothetical protein